MLSNILNEGFSKTFKDGYLTTNVKIGESLVLTLRVLTQDEMIAARMSIPDSAKRDVILYSAVEVIEMLSRAITMVNGQSVVDLAKDEMGDDATAKPEDLAVKTIRAFLLKFPPSGISEIEEAYNSLVKRERDLVVEGGLFKEVENF